MCFRFTDHLKMVAVHPTWMAIAVSSLLIPRVAFAAVPTSPPCLSPVIGLRATDWAGYSANGKYLAVVHAVSALAPPRFGRELEVYAYQWQLQPVRVLRDYKVSSGLITEFEWCGDSLFIAELDGFKTFDEFNDWASSIDEKTPEVKRLAALAGHFHVREWSPAAKALSDVDEMKAGLPGQMLSNGTSGVIVGFDVFSAVPAGTDLSSQRFLTAFVPGAGVRTQVKVKLPTLTFRWPGEIGGLLPLFLTNDGRAMVAVVESAGLLGPQENGAEFNLVAVDLQSGRIVVVSSGQEGHTLELVNSVRAFVPGNPCLVGNSKVAFLLDGSLLGKKVLFHIGISSLNGASAEDVIVDRARAQACGITAGSIVTWTPDGNSVVVQSRDRLYLYDWKSNAGTLLCTGKYVLNVYGWLNPHCLLVQYAPTPQPNHAATRPTGDWGLLWVKPPPGR